MNIYKTLRPYDTLFPVYFHYQFIIHVALTDLVQKSAIPHLFHSNEL